MTRARDASHGEVTPPPLYRWIDAVLMLCANLVHNVRTTLGMICKRSLRDWHTETAREVLPQATIGISSQVTIATHGVILGLVPRISAGPTRVLAIIPLETNNWVSRHKAENDFAGVASSRMKADKVRVPREGGGPVLRAAQAHDHSSALTLDPRLRRGNG